MHQSWKRLSIVFGAALCGALLTGAIMSLPTRMTSGIYADQVSSAIVAKQNLDAAEGLSSAFRNVSESLKPSVVSISTHTAAKINKKGRGGGVPPELGGQLPSWLREELFRQFEQPESRS